jgi:hypothetical protein
MSWQGGNSPTRIGQRSFLPLRQPVFRHFPGCLSNRELGTPLNFQGEDQGSSASAAASLTAARLQPVNEFWIEAEQV